LLGLRGELYYYLQAFAIRLTLQQIFTGNLPFAKMSSRNLKAQVNFLTEVVEGGKRPQKPAVDSPAYSTYGLTDNIWNMMETCWNQEAVRRPSADDIIRLPFLVGVVDDRLVQE
jgi:hypothetical protein